jgi:hypothetical protein
MRHLRRSTAARARVAQVAAATLAGFVALGGCEPAATDGVFADRDAAGAQSDVAGGDSITADGVAAGGLTGQWMQIVEWSTCVKVGSELETRAWRLLKVDAVHSNNRLSETRRLCQLRLSPILGLATVVPQPVIDAHPIMQVESIVIGGEAEGAVYQSGPEVQRFGIEFLDALAEPMPTKDTPDDPRLVDVDNDGKPGATFHVGPSCSIHIAQREVSALRGALVAGGGIEGSGVHTTEQVVFSSTKAICGQAFSTRPNDAHNRFVMVRAEPFDDDGDGVVSCAELGAHAESVLAMTKADDARCTPP